MEEVAGFSQVIEKMERETGLGPATSSLGSWPSWKVERLRGCQRCNCLFTTNYEIAHLVVRCRWINRHPPPDRKCCADGKGLQGSRSMRPTLELVAAVLLGCLRVRRERPIQAQLLVDDPGNSRRVHRALLPVRSEAWLPITKLPELHRRISEQDPRLLYVGGGDLFLRRHRRLAHGDRPTPVTTP